MYGIIPEGQPRRSWVQYEDGTFEPVSEHENIRLKKREPNATDWWTVTRPPEWRPAKYSTTKRGRKGMQELGTDPGVKTMEYRPPVDDTPMMEFSDLFMPPMTGEKPKGPYKTKLGTPTLLGMTQEEYMPILARQEEQEERERAAREGVKLMKSEGAGGAGKASGADSAPPAPAQPAGKATGPRNSAQDVAGMKREEAEQNRRNPNRTAREMEQLYQQGLAENPAQASRDVQALEPEHLSNSARDAARMKALLNRQLGRNSAQAARDLKALEPSAKPNSAQDAHALGRAERRQHNARTDVDHRTEQERGKERAYTGKTGSQLVQEAKDKAYWETRGRNTQEIARESMAKLIKPVTDSSAILRDLEAIRNADHNALTVSEKAELIRKEAQLMDILVPHPAADWAAFMATDYDIQQAKVAAWRKLIAHAANTAGLMGVAPGWGNLVDILAYESVGWALDDGEEKTSQKR